MLNCIVMSQNISCGAILRVYDKDVDNAGMRANYVAGVTEKLLQKNVEIIRPIEKVTIAVWTNDLYVNELGEGAAASKVIAKKLRERFNSMEAVEIIEIPDGEIFCDALNISMESQHKRGITHSLIISPEVIEQTFDTDVYDEMVRAVNDGAYVTGPTIFGDLRRDRLLPRKEHYVRPLTLDESVIHGRIANTFALWDNEKLISVGGFPHESRKRAPHEEQRNVRIGSIEYQLSGVEEIIALIRLAERYGPGIVPIMTDHWHLETDVYHTMSDEQREQHIKKMATKFVRQELMARLALHGEDGVSGLKESYGTDAIALVESAVKEIRVMSLIKESKREFREFRNDMRMR